MSDNKGNEPIYEKNVNVILDALAAGKSQEEVTELVGYSSFKSLSNYMRRKNFSWDGKQGTFYPTKQKRSYHNEEAQYNQHSKAGQIMTLFAEGSLDAKMIAEKMGFTSHRDIAEYMESKGYEWDSEQGNYVRAANFEEDNEGQGQAEGNGTINSDDLASYLPLLELLKENEEQLMELLEQSSNPASIPRYTIPGIATTKSIHMMSSLVNLARDFSREKNISQRDLFESAILEFMHKYGFQKEVEHLLNS